MTRLLVTAALSGAAGGLLAIVIANTLIHRHKRLSPLASPPEPYQLRVWGAFVTVIGGVFGALLVRQGGATWLTVLSGCEVVILFVIFLVDFRAHLILDTVTYPAAVALIAMHAVVPGGRWKAAAVGAIVGFVVYGLLYALGWLLTKQEALGFGDVKLAALVGIMVGFEHAMQSLLMSAVLGGVASIGLLALRQRAPGAFIPYGIFLSAGAAYYLLVPG